MPRAVSADALPLQKFLPQLPFSLTPEQLQAPDRVRVVAPRYNAINDSVPCQNRFGAPSFSAPELVWSGRASAVELLLLVNLL